MESQSVTPNDAQPSIDPAVRSRARSAILKYGLARIALFLGLTIVIQALAMLINAQVPLLITATLALIVAMPLSMFVFKKLRLQATEALATWDAQRKAHKQWVKEQLAER